MSAKWSAGNFWLWLCAAVVFVAGAGAATALVVHRKGESRPTATPQPTAPVCLVAGSCDTLQLTDTVVRTLGVRLVRAKTAGRHDALRLSGSLFLDPNRLVRVHSRFAGEVVSIADQLAEKADSQQPTRPLRLGDHVLKGQLLAVIWSKDVGEKKSDLVNALSQLYLDQAQFKSLSSLGKDVIAQRQLREAERQVEADIIEVDRIERHAAPGG